MKWKYINGEQLNSNIILWSMASPPTPKKELRGLLEMLF